MEALIDRSNRLGSYSRCDKGTEKTTAVERANHGEQRVLLSITVHRVSIDPRKKRRSYIRRLERVMQECDRIVSDPEGYEKLQINAITILIWAIQVCYYLVTDVEVEIFEEQAEEIKRRIAERARKDKEKT